MHKSNLIKITIILLVLGLIFVIGKDYVRRSEVMNNHYSEIYGGTK